MRFLASVLAALLGACAPLPPPPPTPTMGEYKRDVAQRIVQVNADTYAARPPEVLKSIVVLQITVDAEGRASAVSVRSNGYARLEERALASVARAAPFAPPAHALLNGAPSVTFLETFLFREDDLFQVRSLVPDEKLF